MLVMSDLTGKMKLYVKVKVLVIQSCPILCDPMDCSPPGSAVHGILQGPSQGSSQPRDPTHVSRIAARPDIGSFYVGLDCCRVTKCRSFINKRIGCRNYRKGQTTCPEQFPMLIFLFYIFITLASHQSLSHFLLSHFLLQFPASTTNLITKWNMIDQSTAQWEHLAAFPREGKLGFSSKRKENTWRRCT